MNKKHFYFVLITFAFLAASSLAVGTSTALPLATAKHPVSKSTTPSIVNPNLQGGRIPGTNISYHYGIETYQDSGNYTVDDQGVIHEDTVNTHLENFTLDLINSSTFALNDTYSLIVERGNTTSANFTREFWVTNADLQTYETFVTSAPNTIQSFVVNYRKVDTPVYSTNREFLGSVPSNVSLLEYYNGTANITAEIIPKVHLVQYDKIPGVYVELNYTVSTKAFMWYFSRYSMAYNVSAEQYTATIRDGNRLGTHVTAFKNLEMNYTEFQFTHLEYFLATTTEITLKYADNSTGQVGAAIPLEEMPIGLRPSFYQQNGSMTDIGVRTLHTKAIAASTSALQVFHTRLSKNFNNTQVNASSLVAWLVSSTPRLIAYQDVNLDGQLNVEFNPTDGLTLDRDVVPYMGVLEAFRGEGVIYRELNHTYDQQYLTLAGFQVVNESRKGVNETDKYFEHVQVGQGNPNAPFAFEPYFNDPVNDTTNEVYTFNFGIKYVNFPTTWVNMSDGREKVVPMNITYDYVYTIDHKNGRATLSPTITYGAILDPEVKAAVANLGLATMYKSDFLSVQKLSAKRVEETAENVSSTRSAQFASISFAGPGNNFTEVDAGSKQNYTLNGVQHTTKTSVLNLASVSATAAQGNTTVFESDSETVMGSSRLRSSQLSAVQVTARKDIILVSYPQWGGEEIIHDPSFSAVYAPAAENSPAITSAPHDSTYNKGTQVSLEWTVTDPDNDGATYRIFDGIGTELASGTWTSGDIIKYLLTVELGVNSYTLELHDALDNVATHTVKITGVEPPPTSTTAGGTSSTTPADTTTTTVVTAPTGTTTGGGGGSTKSSAPGFEFTTLLAILGSLSIITLRRRK